MQGAHGLAVDVDLERRVRDVLGVEFDGGCDGVALEEAGVGGEAEVGDLPDERRVRHIVGVGAGRDVERLCGGREGEGEGRGGGDDETHEVGSVLSWSAREATRGATHRRRHRCRRWGTIVARRRRASPNLL